MRASKEKRLGLILEILEREEKMRVRDLAQELDITPETLRSDLTDLVQMRLVEREHGFVRLVRLHRRRRCPSARVTMYRKKSPWLMPLFPQ